MVMPILNVKLIKLDQAVSLLLATIWKVGVQKMLKWTSYKATYENLNNFL